MDRTEMRPRGGRSRRGWLLAGLAVVLGTSVCVGQSAAQDIALEDLVRGSDTIAYGLCKKNETRWVGRHLETTTHIEVERYLKGDRGKDLAVTQVGGSISTPIPITQRATNATDFYEGEEVIVFLSKQAERSEELKKKADPGTGLLDTPVVVGGQQGKVGVVTDPVGGPKKIATFRDGGLSLRALKQAKRAAQEQEEKTKKIEENKSEKIGAAQASVSQSAASSPSAAGKPNDAQNAEKKPASRQVVDISQRPMAAGVQLGGPDIVVQTNGKAAELSGLENFTSYMARVESLVNTLDKQKPAYGAPANIQGGERR